MYMFSKVTTTLVFQNNCTFIQTTLFITLLIIMRQVSIQSIKNTSAVFAKFYVACMGTLTDAQRKVHMDIFRKIMGRFICILKS